MLQGIKLGFFWPKKHPAPHCTPHLGIPGQVIPLLPEALIMAKGWERPGEEISHWTDLANHPLFNMFPGDLRQLFPFSLNPDK